MSNKLENLLESSTYCQNSHKIYLVTYLLGQATAGYAVITNNSKMLVAYTTKVGWLLLPLILLWVLCESVGPISSYSGTFDDTVATTLKLVDHQRAGNCVLTWLYLLMFYNPKNKSYGLTLVKVQKSVTL